MTSPQVSRPGAQHIHSFGYLWNTWVRHRLVEDEQKLENLRATLEKQKKRLRNIQCREDNGEGVHLWSFAETCEERITEIAAEIRKRETYAEDWRRILRGEAAVGDGMKKRVEESRKSLEDEFTAWATWMRGPEERDEEDSPAADDE